MPCLTVVDFPVVSRSVLVTSVGAGVLPHTVISSELDPSSACGCGRLSNLHSNSPTLGVCRTPALDAKLPYAHYTPEMVEGLGSINA